MESERQFLAGRMAVLSVPGGLFLAVFLAGLAYLFMFSFWHFEAEKRMAVPGFEFDNYARFLTDPFFYTFLWRTLRVSLFTTLICLVMGYPVAWVLARSRSLLKKRLLLMAVVVTALIGVVNRSYSWLILLGVDGPLNYFLTRLGLDAASVHNLLAPLTGLEPMDAPQAWGLLFNEFAVVVGLIHRLLPFMIIFLSIALENVDPTLEAMSRSLGGGPMRTFRKITLPLSLPGALAGSLFVFGLSASDFVMPSLLGGLKVKTMSNLIYENALLVMNFPFGSAMAFIMIGSIVLIFAGVGGFALAMRRRRNIARRLAHA